jgi:hypothetical protein
VTAADPAQLAERLRTALIERAVAALEDARISGLCWEGAWEAAVAAMKTADLTALLDDVPPAKAPETPRRT